MGAGRARSLLFGAPSSPLCPPSANAHSHPTHKKRRFGATMEQKVTSFRPAPPPNVLTDPNQPGAIATLSSEVFLNGDQIGIGSWNRIVVVREEEEEEEEERRRGMRGRVEGAKKHGTTRSAHPSPLRDTPPPRPPREQKKTKYNTSPTTPSTRTRPTATASPTASSSPCTSLARRRTATRTPSASPSAPSGSSPLTTRASSPTTTASSRAGRGGSWARAGACR